jgi:hypothetical protein
LHCTGPLRRLCNERTGACKGLYHRGTHCRARNASVAMIPSIVAIRRCCQVFVFQCSSNFNSPCRKWFWTSMVFIPSMNWAAISGRGVVIVYPFVWTPALLDTTVLSNKRIKWCAVWYVCCVCVCVCVHVRVRVGEGEEGPGDYVRVTGAAFVRDQ